MVPKNIILLRVEITCFDEIHRETVYLGKLMMEFPDESTGPTAAGDMEDVMGMRAYSRAHSVMIATVNEKGNVSGGHFQTGTIKCGDVEKQKTNK